MVGCPGEKGGAKIGSRKRGKGTKWIVLVDGAGTPLGAYLDAASPAEVTLLEQTLASEPIRGTLERLIADRGYDSNAVRRFLKRRCIQPIIPARSNNTQATDQDGRCRAAIGDAGSSSARSAGSATSPADGAL
jgi:hypothetical protein